VTHESRAEDPASLGALADLVGASMARGAAPSHDRPEDITVTDITDDSRRVAPGSLFVCRLGGATDGHDFAAAAIAAGAVALVTERPLGLGVPELRVGDARAAMAPLAAAIFGHPADAMTIVAVTGTNGKTTVTHLVASIFDAAGRPAAPLGTLSGWANVPTNPQPPDLHRRLAELRAEGTEVIAMEVSSQALVANRVDGIVADVAVFTNLSRDHLELHGSMEEYFAAKARLFQPERARRAVVNLDDPHGRLLSDAALIPTEGFSLADVDELVVGPDGSRFRWRGVDVSLGLPGRFNVSNAVAAATAASAAGIAPESIAAGLAAARPMRGRFEVVEIPAPFTVVVDYAHTPDALEHLVTDAGELAERVVLVFGCGGDKDRGKRAPMGAVASQLADVVIVTSDNPRSEAPEAIIDDILAGVTRRDHVVVEADRRRAIAHALEEAGPGDLVIVAGKGHETEQVVGDERIPFDDRVVIVEEHRRLRGTAS
jgi:UDP-N-acetylmuramoyl-L-alanyl-D-glutamate--2,6-diaminopimelate ligase